MEAAAVACRGGLLARARPGDRARARVRRHGVAAGPAVRRRLLVASLGDPLSAPSPNAVAVAQEAVQVDDDVASNEILQPPADHVKTVHVKFVMRKQCAFGQRFLVVGDDPALGIWDPTEATALDWSEGHVWTVKKNLRANKLIEFKFLLQDPSGQVRWQHGPNRTLQTTETSNTLVVYEDWDDAKKQEVSEEVELSIGSFHLADKNRETNNGVTTVSVDGEKSTAPADTSLHGEKMGANETNQPQLSLDKGKKVPDEIHRKANTVAQDSNPVAAADYGGGNGEDASAPVENRSANMFENGMVWAKKALQQLLRSLGFQIGTTKT